MGFFWQNISYFLSLLYVFRKVKPSLYPRGYLLVHHCPPYYTNAFTGHALLSMCIMLYMYALTGACMRMHVFIYHIIFYSFSIVTVFITIFIHIYTAPLLDTGY